VLEIRCIDAVGSLDDHCLKGGRLSKEGGSVKERVGRRGEGISQRLAPARPKLSCSV
jgi:hypothetical protein